MTILRPLAGSWLRRVLVLSTLLAAGCGPPAAGVLGPTGSGLSAHVYRQPLGPGTRAARTHTTLPASAFQRHFDPLGWFQPSRPLTIADKVHPVLLAKLLAGTTGPERVLITMRNVVIAPAPPMAAPDASDSLHITSFNRDRARYDRLLTSMRDSISGAFADTLHRRFGIVTVERFRTTATVLADVRLSQLTTLASSPDIAYIQPIRLGEGTPQGLGDLPPCSDEACQTVARARQILGTDLYCDGYGRGPISLFDTGVTITHPLLAPVSSRFLALSDCLSGDAHCTPSSPGAVDECDGHGTSTAAILTGSDAMGADTRGVLTANIHSFMVYERLTIAHCRPDPDYPSIHRAFDDATLVDHPDPLIVAEVAGNTTANEGISTDADNAFWDHGVMVVAALGNTPGAQPGSPGNARCAFSAGLYDIRSPSRRSTDQSGGVTDDGRTKPDAIFPSCTRTASLRPGFAVDEFDGTSGATPYAGALAAILHDWLADDAGWVDPGQVYAAMIALGDEQRTRDGYAYPKYEGAGRVMMPADGYVWWGKVDLHDGEDVTIPIDLTGNGGELLSVALWWPERNFADVSGQLLDTHSDIDLYVLRANGDEAAHSIGKKGVFERLTVALGAHPATWSIRAHATSVRPAVGLQTVYWFALTRPVPN